MLYIITYDINTTIKDYTSLYERIKQLGNSYQHPLESVWFISADSDYSATDICNILKKEMTDKDNIFVAKLANENDVQGWLPKTFWEWFKTEIQ